MKKAIIALVSVLSVFSLSAAASAATRGNNVVGDVVNGAENMVEGVVEGAGGVVRGAGNAVEGAVEGATDRRNVNDIVDNTVTDNGVNNTRTDLPNDRTTEAEVVNDRNDRNPSTGVPVAGFVTVGAAALSTAAAALIAKKRK